MKPIFLTLSLLMVSLYSSAQNQPLVVNPDVSEHKVASDNQVRVFLNLGLGGAFSNTDHGFFSLCSSVGVKYKKNVFTALVIGSKEPKGDHLPREKISDYGLLYGRAINGGSNSIVLFSAGISYNSGTFRGKFLHNSGNWLFGGTTHEYEAESFSGIGIPLEVALIIGTRTFCGLTMSAFGNINGNHSYGGILFCIRFGPLGSK